MEISNWRLGVFFLLLTVVYIPLSACKHDNNQDQDQERLLSVSSQDTQHDDISSYYSYDKYGSTLRLYYFKGQNSVVKLIFPNTDIDFSISGSINIFSMSESEDNILSWINNQYSDALVNAPTPIHSVEINSRNSSIIGSEYVDSEIGFFGDQYDNYKVQFSVENIAESGVFNLTEFEGETIIHVQTVGSNVCDHTSLTTGFLIKDKFGLESNTFQTGEEITFEIVVTNNTNCDFPYAFTYPADGLVIMQDGNTVWSKYYNMIFSQSLPTTALKSGESLTYQTVWTGIDLTGAIVDAGTYTVEPSLVVFIYGEGVTAPTPKTITLY